MKKFIGQYLMCLVALLATVYSLSGCTTADDRNRQAAVAAGYEFAGIYIDTEMTDMQRQKFLLDIRAREHRLRTDFGDDIADAFVKAFSDSAFVNTENK